MKGAIRTVLMALCLCPLAAWGNQRANVTCALAGSVSTAGIPSTNKAAIVYPGCTIAVYLTGTHTLAVIYSDNNNTAKANPFVADTTGNGFFYAALGRYDITFSGGGLPSPQTFGDVLLQDVVALNIGPPGGNNGEGQYNNNGVFSGMTGTSWNPTTQTFTTPNINVPGGLPSAQVTYPPACSTGVYVPATNTCVPSGTAANAAPPVGSGQMNVGGSFGSIPGFMADPTNGWITAGGVGYAKGYQNGAGNNGIANCFVTGTNCMADPTYGSTEVPYTQAGPVRSQSPQNSWFSDTRGGVRADFFHNPIGSTYINFLYHIPWHQIVVNDRTQGPGGTGSSNVSTEVRAFYQDLYFTSPGLSLGNTGLGPCCWSSTIGFSQNILAVTPGITTGIGNYVSKAGIGDNVGLQSYLFNYGGAVAASDEGNEALRILSGTASTQLVGSTSGVATGATSVVVTCTQDCANPGDGRFLITTQVPVATGNVTATTAPSGATPGTYTTDVTVPTSSAWGTLNGSCVPAVSAPSGLAGTQITCTVTMNASSPRDFQAGDNIMFGGGFHEQSTVLASPAPTHTSFTAMLRKAHGSGAWVMANGPQGYIDFAVRDVTVGTTQLNFPHDIIGADSAHTLRYLWDNPTGSTVAPGVVAGQYNTTGNTTNIGGIVYMNVAGGGVSPQQTPAFYNSPAIYISGTGTAYDGVCTNTFLVLGQSQQLGCTQAASNGVAAVTGAKINLTSASNPTPYGATAFKLWQGAEVLDVNTFVGTYGETCPANICTFTVEPNNVAWGTGSVIEPQHYAWTGHQLRMGHTVNNPAPYSASGWQTAFAGIGMTGGLAISPTSNADWNITNQNTNGIYAYHGGGTTPTGMFQLNGLFNYAIAMQYAPDPVGTPAIYIGCPLSGCADPNYNYNLVSLNANWTMLYRPFASMMQINGSTLFYGNLARTFFNDNISAAALSTPAAPTVTNSVTGGTIASGIQRCYTTVSYNLAGSSPQGPEQCVTPAVLALTSVATASGGNTVYTGTITGGASNGLLGSLYTVAGFTNAGNNGSFRAVASTATTLTLANSAGVAETATATATGTTNSITIQWAYQHGAEGYKVCEGPTGGPYGQVYTMGFSVLQAALVGWVDTGATPGAGCSTTNTSLPALDPWAYLNLQNQASGFASKLVPTTLTANRTITLPDTTGTMPVVIYTGTTSMPTTAVAAGGCSGVGTNTPASTPNVLQTDSIKWSWQGAPGSVTGNLILNPFVTNGGMGFIYCNPGAASQTPPAATLSWSVTR